MLIHYVKEIEAILGIPTIDSPGMYLGLPIIWGRSKYEVLSFVKEKVAKKLKGWK